MRSQGTGLPGYQGLEVYQRSYGRALEVHRLSATFPGTERTELGRQLREATESIPADIAEGYGRRGARDRARFLVMGAGSCEEVQVWLSFAKDLGSLEKERYEALRASYQEIARMLEGLRKAWSS